MANGNGSNLTKYYLNIISTLCALLLGIMSYMMSQAVTRNDEDHRSIKQVQAQKVDADEFNRLERSLDKLCDRITQFIDNAPPRHVHTDRNGNVTRVAP